MTGHHPIADGPALAGRDLAELADRLRLRPGGGVTGTAPAWISRLLAAARLWRVVGDETGLRGCGDLAAGLEALAEAVHVGGALDDAAAARLARLDAGLTDLLARRDAGLDPGQLAADPAWRTLVRHHAEHGPALGAAAPPAVESAVALLVASPFLREILASRLAAAGHPVAAAAAPADVPALLAGPRPPALVLCDNEEPTNHLRTLRRLLAGASGPAPALVLVASGVGPSAGRVRRARAAGADGVWPEPWRAEQLPLPPAAGGQV